jgi:protein tyrosine/serine phosphatase
VGLLRLAAEEEIGGSATLTTDVGHVMGAWMRILTIVLAFGIVATVVAAPLWYKVEKHKNYRNLRVVDPGMLFRSGQLTPEALDRTIREKGLKTVVSLREKKDHSVKDADNFEAALCKERGVGHYRLDVPDWENRNGVVGGERTLEEFRKLVEDPKVPKPILIHCFAGEHRTGALVAVYRMEYNGWSNAEAIEEMTSMGNSRTTFHDTLLAYLRGYAPRGNAGRTANPK